jgi:hypothetical protein
VHDSPPGNVITFQEAQHAPTNSIGRHAGHNTDRRNSPAGHRLPRHALSSGVIPEHDPAWFRRKERLALFPSIRSIRIARDPVTDHTGSLRKMLPVAETRLVNNWLAIADDGGLYVRQLVTDSGGTSERILRLDSVGRATKTWEFKSGLFTSALIGDQIVAVSGPNKLQVHGQNGALIRSIEWTTTQKPTQLTATAMSAQRVAVIDPINLRLQIVNAATSTSTSVQLRLQGVDPQPGDLAIADVTSTGDGTMYLLAAKGKFKRAHSSCSWTPRVGN